MSYRIKDDIDEDFLRTLRILGLPIKIQNRRYVVLRMYFNGNPSHSEVLIRIINRKGKLKFFAKNIGTLDTFLKFEGPVSSDPVRSEGDRAISIDERVLLFPLARMPDAYDPTQEFYLRDVEAEGLQEEIHQIGIVYFEEFDIENSEEALLTQGGVVESHGYILGENLPIDYEEIDFSEYLKMETDYIRVEDAPLEKVAELNPMLLEYVME